MRMSQASAAVQAAQKEIAALVSAAAREQCWDEVMKLTEVGQRLKSVEAHIIASPTSLNKEAFAEEDRPEGQAASNSTATSKSVKKGVYPRFCRDGEVLVKIAWSKSRREEYEHKSPRKVLTLMIDAMLKVGSKGKRFTMDQLIPLRDPQNPGINVPDYQPYVCVAWLRQESLIKQYGRSGYSIPKTDALSDATGKCWDRLELR